jgi:hypothetical protein
MTPVLRSTELPLVAFWFFVDRPANTTKGLWVVVNALPFSFVASTEEVPPLALAHHFGASVPTGTSQELRPASRDITFFLPGRTSSHIESIIRTMSYCMHGIAATGI